MTDSLQDLGVSTSQQYKSDVSFGPYTNRPEQNAAQAINVLFDRLENLTPRYVSRMPAMLLGMIVGCCIVALGIDGVRRDRRIYKESSDPILRIRWIVLLGVVLIVAAFVSGQVTDFVFKTQNITVNSQHLANVNWLKSYADALR